MTARLIMKLRVEETRLTTSDVLHLQLVHPLRPALPEWAAGAHVDLRLPDGRVRQYSLCGDPDDSSRYEIAIKREATGRGGSIWAHENLHGGSEVHISAPRNNLPLNAEGERYILIAGGIGITPLLSMARTLNRWGKDFILHYCARSASEAPLLAELRDICGPRLQAILERYGMTETNMNTSNPYDGERVPGAVGFPLPGVSVRVTEPETGKELPREEIGMIEVKGPNVFKGYWRMPEKTKSEFRPDGFFITGDLGKIDDKGYVHILGRGKDLVISGGFNVYPKEIESEIDAMPGVIESAVIGVPHADFGEGVTAVLVCNKGADVTEGAVLKALDGRLAKFKMPKRVFVVDELPRNTMGKVQKNILRDTYKDIYAKK